MARAVLFSRGNRGQALWAACAGNPLVGFPPTADIAVFGHSIPTSHPFCMSTRIEQRGIQVAKTVTYLARSCGRYSGRF